MKLHFTKCINTLAVRVALSLPFVGAAAQSSHSRARGLEGTWTVEVTQQDCTTGDPLGTPFYSLLTLAAGGTMTENHIQSEFLSVRAWAGPWRADVYRLQAIRRGGKLRFGMIT
jgi:hypothetical protein